MKSKSWSRKQAGRGLIDSGAQNVLLTDGESRSADGLGVLEVLRSRTVLTEVREGVVALERLGLFLNKLELDGTD